MSEKFNKMIREELERRNLSERAASERAGLSPTTLNYVLKHAAKNPTSATVKKIARFFGFNEDEVLVLTGHRTPRAIVPPPTPYTEFLRRAELEAPVAIPVYDQIIHAGEGGFPMDYTYLPPTEARGRKLAAAYVKGDCMEPVISEGSLIIVDLEGSPTINDVVVVVVDNEDVEVKRFVGRANGKIRLACENPTYPESVVEDVRIMGVVIQVTKQLKG